MPLAADFESKKSPGGEGGINDARRIVRERFVDAGRLTDNHRHERFIVIIDNRALQRDCLARSVRSHHRGASVATFASVNELRLAKELYHNVSAILLTIGGLKITDRGVAADIEQLKSEFATVPFIIVADDEDLAQILKALEMGACGYIQTTVSISVAVGVIELALAGGVFVPARSLLSLQGFIASNNSEARPLHGVFTVRQSEVVEALRRGKANKTIAYELNMCESTVKVHVRNILKKLNATNRTEAAYKLGALVARDGQASA